MEEERKVGKPALCLLRVDKASMRTAVGERWRSLRAQLDLVLSPEEEELIETIASDTAAHLDVDLILNDLARYWAKTAKA
jgi:hypothetical protein